jgi:putative transposase
MALNLALMKLIDEQYTRTPFYGSPRVTWMLRSKGYGVNHKRVERLMHLMGISAIYPKPRTSHPNPENKVYPYLLKGLEITRPNQVWCADITYIRMLHGFLYLFAIMDWYSRYVLAWELSNTLDSSFCLAGVQTALAIAKPEIFNTDQGSQFTAQDFTNILITNDIQISMDGRGRAFDNIFVERLWRTVKYEEVYLHDYQNGREAYQQLSKYFRFYNEERPHQALDYGTPGGLWRGEKSRYLNTEKNQEICFFSLENTHII